MKDLLNNGFQPVSETEMVMVDVTAIVPLLIRKERMMVHD